MLTDLPQELLLAVLSYLHLQDIANLSCLTKAWCHFINDNSASIYRAAAITELDVPPSADSVQGLRDVYSPRALLSVTDWKSLCIRLQQIKKSWRGVAPSTITVHQPHAEYDVHRFKVDEQAGLIIATTGHGGLIVSDLDGSKWYQDRTSDTPPRTNFRSPDHFAVLWRLPNARVRPYAHVEYGHGYLIFDRFESKEVWRLAEYDYYYPSRSNTSEDVSPPTAIPQAAPDEWQTSGSSVAAEVWLHLSDDDDESGLVVPLMTPPRKGHFVPWALLRPPTRTRAFRFVYPFLLLASFGTAYVYDVRTGALVQEFRDIQGLQPDENGIITGPALGDLNYVEHCPQYVFICGETCIRVFSRQTGKRVYDIPAVHDNYGCSRWTLSTFRNDRNTSLNFIIGGNVDNDPLKAWENAGPVLYHHDLVKDEDRTQKYVDQIIATHVSSCGNYLAVMLETSRLLIIRDLHNVIKGQVSLFDSTVEIQLGNASRFSKYLAFEYGRVGLATRNGIFIVIPHPSFFSSKPLTPSSPPPTVLRVHPLNDPFILSSISCLQMTPTGLFVNWSPICPLVRHAAGHTESHRRNIFVVQDEVFWSGLESLCQISDQNGHALVVEEAMMAEPSDSVVLSIDFVPT